MRSARPCGKAGCEPGHNMIIGGKRTHAGLMGRSTGETEASFTGVQSPPLRGKACPARIDQRGESGDDAKGVFLGGARSPRPHGTAGRMARHCVATGAFPRSRWPRRDNVGVSVMPSSRACGARPSRGTIQGKMALWGKARKWRQGWFSRRGAVSAPALRGLTHARTFHYPRWVAGWP